MRVVAVLCLVVALVACAKEEWNRNQLGVANPYSTETEETEPAEETENATTTQSTTTTGTPDAALDAPADVRADGPRDATGQ